MVNKGFSFLSELLPSKIKIDSKELEIDTRTITALAVIFYLQEEHTDIEKANYTTLKLFQKSYNSVLQYFNCTSERLDNVIVKYLNGYPKASTDAKKRATSNFLNKDYKKPDFDLIQDSGAILSSFRQSYNICLADLQQLHWWEFLALFYNLSGENAFNNIRHIRTMEIDTKHDSPKRQEQIKKAKKAVALIDTRSEKQKQADLQAQFNALA